MTPLAAFIHWMPPARRSPLVAKAVAMLHVAIQHVGEGNEAPVGMVWKTSDVVVRVLAAKLVEHEEGVQVSQRRGANGAMDRNACSLGEGQGGH